jgi:hypothetical protein
MVIDTLLFNNEFDMLDIHLAITDHYVDKWIILEASRTFSGIIKPFYLSENQDKIKKYKDRIEIITLELDETQINLICETAMRKGFKESLEKFDDEDIIIHGDLDEIINPERWSELLRIMNQENKPVSCSLDMYFYKFDQKAIRGWKGSVVARKRMFETPHDLYKGSTEVVKKKVRTNCVGSGDPAGWHWSWIGSDDIIKNKVVSCIETQKRDPNQVLNSFKEKDTISAINHKAQTEIIEPKYPKVVFDILRQYPDYWHNPPGEI